MNDLATRLDALDEELRAAAPGFDRLRDVHAGLRQRAAEPGF